MSKMYAADYRSLTTAKRGFGDERKRLIEELWFVERDITHYIIAYQAGKDPEADAARAKAEEKAQALRDRLDQITKPNYR